MCCLHGTVCVLCGMFYFSLINGPTMSVPYYWQQEPKAHSGLGPVLHEVVSKSEKLLT